MKKITTGSLVAAIRKAFVCELPLETFSDEDFKELKWELPRFDDESSKKWLPLLLIHEIGRPTARNGDSLVYFLDGNMSARDEDERRRLLPERRRYLDRFTDDEAAAVLRWLSEAAAPKYGGLCGEDLKSAVAYWQGRLNTNPRGGPNADRKIMQRRGGRS